MHECYIMIHPGQITLFAISMQQGCLLADERCTRAVLDLLRTTKVGSRVGPRAVPPKPGEGEEVAERGAGEAERGQEAGKRA